MVPVEAGAPRDVRWIDDVRTEDFGPYPPEAMVAVGERVLRARDGDVAAAREMLIDTLRRRRAHGLLPSPAVGAALPTRILSESEDGGRPRLVLRSPRYSPRSRREP